jgi:DNA-binding IclR family transcriptional regulator
VFRTPSLNCWLAASLLRCAASPVLNRRDAVLAAITVSKADVAAFSEATGLPEAECDVRIREASGSMEIALARVTGVRIAGSHTD